MIINSHSISGDLRLGGYPTLAPFAGVLQIFHNGQWGTIGGDSDPNAWNVACRQLFGVDHYSYAYHTFFWTNHKYPVNVGDLTCTGDEDRLIDCIYDAPADPSDDAPNKSIYLVCDVEGM